MYCVVHLNCVVYLKVSESSFLKFSGKKKGMMWGNDLLTTLIVLIVVIMLQYIQTWNHHIVLLPVCVLSYSAVYYSLHPHGPQPARPLCPWNFPGKNTGAGCHLLLQGTSLTQGSNPRLSCLLYWQVGALPLSHPGNPWYTLNLHNIMSIISQSWIEKMLLNNS